MVIKQRGEETKAHQKCQRLKLMVPVQTLVPSHCSQNLNFTATFGTLENVRFVYFWTNKKAAEIREEMSGPEIS